jgi:hypothetical protein
MQLRLARGAAVLVMAGLAARSRLALAAPADSEPLDLEWIAPSACPTRATALDDIARILDRSTTEPPLARVTARALLFRGEDARWHVVLTVSGDAAGERTLDASSCEELTNAAALVLALRIDPTLLMPEPVLPPGSATTPSPAVAPSPPPADGASPPVIPPEPTSAHVPRRPKKSLEVRLPPRDAFVLGALLVGGAGEMPSVDIAAEVVGGWTRDRLRLELFLATGPVQHASVAGRGEEGASVRLVRGGLRGCYAAIDSRFTLSGCATGEVDGLWVDGSGTSIPEDARAGELALGVGALGTWRVARRFALRVQVDGLVPFPRPSFVIDDSAGKAVVQVYRPFVVVGRAAFGAEVSFF